MIAFFFLIYNVQWITSAVDISVVTFKDRQQMVFPDLIISIRNARKLFGLQVIP